MAQVELTWIERQRYLAVDSGGHSAVFSGKDDVGVKPSEALLMALAGCSAHDVVEIIGKRKLSLDKLTVTVTAEQAEKAPWAFLRIHLRYAASAAGLELDQLNRAIDLSLNKYCSVRASLAPEVDVSFEAVVE
ncbi:OsmC family protein [Chloroflexales bacterium ZM16-3]|nr:OsmC family protein [Chloroflexales bacterium ZM16-3]